MSFFFGALRNKPGPSLYSESSHAVYFDLSYITLISVLIAFVATLFISVLTSLPNWQKVRQTCNIVFAIAVVEAMLVSIYGQHWKSCDVVAHTVFKANGQGVMNARIKLLIGLQDINITLTGIPEMQQEERIKYNERLHLYTGSDIKDRLAPGNRYHLLRGSPAAILDIIDYLSFDGGNIRWGRSTRLAGYYTKGLLWASFAMWIYTCVMFNVCPCHGPLSMFMTGMMAMLALMVYLMMQDSKDLAIPLGDSWCKIPRLQFEWCFWVIAVTCALLIVLGIGLMVAQEWIPNTADTFLYARKQLSDEACVLDTEIEMRSKVTGKPSQVPSFNKMPSNEASVSSTQLVPMTISAQPMISAPGICVTQYPDETPLVVQNTVYAGATPWPGKLANDMRQGTIQQSNLHSVSESVLTSSAGDSGMRSEVDSGLPSGSEIPNRYRAVLTSADSGRLARFHIYSDNDVPDAASNSRYSTIAQHGSENDDRLRFRSTIFSTDSDISAFLHGHRICLRETPDGEVRYLMTPLINGSFISPGILPSATPDSALG